MPLSIGGAFISTTLLGATVYAIVQLHLKDEELKEWRTKNMTETEVVEQEKLEKSRIEYLLWSIAGSICFLLSTRFIMTSRRSPPRGGAMSPRGGRGGQGQYAQFGPPMGPTGGQYPRY